MGAWSLIEIVFWSWIFLFSPYNPLRPDLDVRPVAGVILAFVIIDTLMSVDIFGQSIYEAGFNRYGHARGLLAFSLMDVSAGICLALFGKQTWRRQCAIIMLALMISLVAYFDIKYGTDMIKSKRSSAIFGLDLLSMSLVWGQLKGAGKRLWEYLQYSWGEFSYSFAQFFGGAGETHAENRTTRR